MKNDIKIEENEKTVETPKPLKGQNSLEESPVQKINQTLQNSMIIEEKESKIKKVFGNWFGLLMVIIVGIVIYYGIYNISLVFSAFTYLTGLIKPVIYGGVIAYLLNPLMLFYRYLFEKLFLKIGKKQNLSKGILGLIKGISITLAMLSGLLIIVVLIWLIVPQLINSIATLANNLPEQANVYYKKSVDWIEHSDFVAKHMQNFALDITKQIDELINKYFLPWVQSDFLTRVNDMAFRFANGLFNVLAVLYNIFIGCIVAIYLLKDKDIFAAQCKKIIYGVFGKKQADVVLHYSRMTNNMFSGFITGKILDSTIIGILCFVVMSIFHLPYTLLVSVIVGVTNIIPVFGPYIGAIPCALLILLISPMKCLYFIIMIVIIQQLDGNIIGPAILGESTGLSAFWVLASILLFGGMWGIAGMIVGVPLFAVIYCLIKDYIELRLFRKNMLLETSSYLNLKDIVLDEEEKWEYIPFTKEEIRSSKLREKQENSITLRSLLIRGPRLKGKIKKKADAAPKEKKEN